MTAHRAYFTMDESGAAVFERSNDVIVVPADLAKLLPLEGDMVSEPMTDAHWEKLRTIVKEHKEAGDE